MENENEKVKLEVRRDPQAETIKMKETSECKVIGAVLAVGVLGFWYGIGAALDANMVNGLEELISGKC